MFFRLKKTELVRFSELCEARGKKSRKERRTSYSITDKSTRFPPCGSTKFLLISSDRETSQDQHTSDSSSTGNQTSHPVRVKSADDNTGGSSLGGDDEKRQSEAANWN